MSGERAIGVTLCRTVAESYDEWDAAWDWFERAMPDLHLRLANRVRVGTVYAEALARLASGNYAVP